MDLNHAAALYAYAIGVDLADKTLLDKSRGWYPILTVSSIGQNVATITYITYYEYAVIAGSHYGYGS